MAVSGRYLSGSCLAVCFSGTQERSTLGIVFSRLALNQHVDGYPALELLDHVPLPRNRI